MFQPMYATAGSHRHRGAEELSYKMQCYTILQRMLHEDQSCQQQLSLHYLADTLCVTMGVHHKH